MFTPREVIKLMMKISREEGTDLMLDPAAGSGAFLTAVLQGNFTGVQEEHQEESASLSNLALEAINKLDGVWSVQLFFRTWPYYFTRANKAGNDPYEDADVVMSESLPVPDLPPDIAALYQVYTTQMWAMSIVYLEAILEHYFLGTIEYLNLGIAKKGRRPRQASLLFEYLKANYLSEYGKTISITPEEEWHLYELTGTRHLWVHKNGIVDDTYIRDTEGRTSGKPSNWDEIKPTLGQERRLSEAYIKGSIYFARKLISQVEEQLLMHKLKTTT